MKDYGELIDANTVRFERILPGPIERVWSYLTDGEKRAQWFCAGDVEGAVDGKADMHFHNMSLSKEGDIPRPEKYQDRPEKISCAGAVTRYEPPRILHHTWEFGEESSEVCYELTTEGDKVRLVLTHRRLHSLELAQDVGGGWHTHLNVLEDVLGGSARRPFYSMQLQYDAEYAKRMSG